MLRLACCSVLALLALLVSLPAAPPPPPVPTPVLEAGGCTFWQCSLGGTLTPSMFVCISQCGGGVCSPVNVCSQ